MCTMSRIGLLLSFLKLHEKSENFKVKHLFLQRKYSPVFQCEK